MDNSVQLRRIDKSFADAFKSSSLYKLYKEHTDELFLGVRNGYINLYHLCNSIAKVSLTRKGVKSEIASYYINGIQKSNYDNDMIVGMYETIKVKSRNKSKLEKQAQQTLALLNNSNPHSNWFCIDVEYEKPKMAGRFDIIAVTKKIPHRVALIELKYGTNAYGGKSGILTHVKDFSNFVRNGNYETLRKDIEEILSSMAHLNVNIPDSLKGLKAGELCATPEFYFITVNSKASKAGAASAKQTMAGYLFKKDNPKYSDWHCKRHSINAIEDILGYDITEKKSPFYATLLFSDQDIASLRIDDIIDGEYSERIPPHSYEDEEKKRYNDFLIDSKYLYGDKGHFKYSPKFRLWNENNNLFRPILEKASHYFSKDENGIEWFKIKNWGENGTRPTKHVLSSQVACINHLFPIREDPDAVLAIAKTVEPEISEVVLLDNDKSGSRGYISFEVISNKDYLNEADKKTGKLCRGEFCTSVDALIIGIRNGKRIMLVIEWKYTESYNNEDKSIEANPKIEFPNTSRGDTRIRNYSGLIKDSHQLQCLGIDELRGSVFFFEPFYQLMRQTLWAEQMIEHKETEILKADDFVHVHVIPTANKDLLEKVYPISGKNMKETWSSVISDKSKYRIITPEGLYKRVDREKYEELIDYLKHRYWLGDRQI